MPLLQALVLVAFLVHAVSATAPIPPLSTGIYRSLLTSNIAKCPCSVHVHRSRSSRSRTIGNSFDLLAVRKDEWDRISTHANRDAFQINFAARYSSLNVSDSSATDSDAFLDHFRDRKIEEEGEFVVVLRTARADRFDPSDYIVRLRSVNHQSRSCPVMLTPDPPTTGKEVRRSLQRQTAPEPRIVGGDFVSPNLAPYLVVIYNPEKRFCSGALLSPRWVVTAAHCAVNKTFTVGLLTTQANENGGGAKISRVFQHPKYGSTGPPRQNDITVFELAKPAPKGSKFMMINQDKAKPKPGEFARVAGYGTISYLNAINDESPRSLRQVDVPITTYDQCSETYNRWEIISKTKQVCAGYFNDGGCDACSGDSGGPLIQYTSDGTPTLVGLTSYGLGCALANYPGVYNRIAAFLPWLQSTPAVFTLASNTGTGNGTTVSSPEAPPSSQPNPSPKETPASKPKPSQTATSSSSSTPSPQAMKPARTVKPSRMPKPSASPRPNPKKSRAPSPALTKTPSPAPQKNPPSENTPKSSPTPITPQKNPTTQNPPKPSGSKGGPCLKGWKLKDGRCVVCYKHAVSPGGFVSSCELCPRGFTRDMTDSSKCTCGAGREPIGASCVQCRPGWFASAKDERCKRCPEGYFTSQYGTWKCKKCPLAGQVPTKDQKKCRECSGSDECNKAKRTNRVVNV